MWYDFEILSVIFLELGSLTTSHINLRPETSRTTHGNETKNRPSRTTHTIPDALTKSMLVTNCPRFVIKF